jgi:hypothetical protein
MVGNQIDNLTPNLGNMGQMTFKLTMRYKVGKLFLKVTTLTFENIQIEIKMWEL